MMTILSWIAAFVHGVKQSWLRARGAGPVPVPALAAPAAAEAGERAIKPVSLAPAPVALVPPPPAPKLKLVKGEGRGLPKKASRLGKLHLVQTATSASALVVSLASSGVAPPAVRAARVNRSETFIAGRDARVFSLDQFRQFRGAQYDRGVDGGRRKPHGQS